MSSELFIRGFVKPCNPEKNRERHVRRALAVLGYDGPAHLFSRPYLTIAIGTRQATGGLRTLWQEPSHSGALMAAIRPRAVLRSVGSSQPETAFKGIEQIGEQGAEAAGIMIKVSAGEDRLQLRNDGAGFVPLYFGVLEKGDFIASTSLHATIALGACHALDEQAAFEYLTYLHPLGNRTLLSNICCLPPGSLLQWHPREGIDVSQSARSFYHPALTDRQEPLGRDEMIVRFREMWSSVMGQLGAQLGDDGAVSLSGGLDSRTICHGLVDAGLRPRCFTNGEPYLREVQLARQVAQRLDLPHHVVELGEDDYLSHVDESILALDGVHSPFEMYLAWHADALRSITSTIVQGQVVDILLGRPMCSYYQFSFQNLSEVKIAILANTSNIRGFIRHFIAGDLQNKFSDLIAHSLDESLLFFSGIDPSQIGTFWNFYHRQRRWSFAANSVMWRQGFDFLVPFIFSSFLEYAGSISVALRNKGKLYFDIHDKVFTRTRDIPYLLHLVAPKYLSQGVYEYGYQSHERLNRLRGRLSLLSEVLKGSVPDCMRYLREMLLQQIARFNERTSRPWRLPKACRAYLPVYRHAEWLRGNKVYRQRYLDLLERVRSSPPRWIDPRALVTSADAIYHGNIDFDPLLLGRLITLCLWAGLWSSMAATARQSPDASGDQTAHRSPDASGNQVV